MAAPSTGATPKANRGKQLKKHGWKRSALAVLLVFAAPAAAIAAAPGEAAEQPFKRGLNVLGYDPYWTDPSTARFKWRHFAEIRRAGFDHVRINLFAFRHMDESGRLDATWLKRLDAAIAAARRAGLAVILDEHDFDECSSNVAACRVRLTSFWSQVGERYRGQPRTVAFEPLNEPHGALDSEWNHFYPDLLAIVRRSNPTRPVVIGPTHWNSFRDLDALELPADDRNILVTIHYYEPFEFTHQGAPWTDRKDKLGVSWGTLADRERLKADFAKAAAWGRSHHRPILLGEFGAYDRSGTPIAMRMAYTDAVAREAERQGFGWTYWQFDNDFIAWDMKGNRWFEPIRNALIPKR